MKASGLLFSFLFILVLFCSSFAILPGEDFEIKYLIKGVSHELTDGIKPSEFGELTISSSNKEIKVEAFQITLARGNRAVEITDVNGDKFNLRKYYGTARSGDRIVIEVKELSDQAQFQKALSVVAIRIN